MDEISQGQVWILPSISNMFGGHIHKDEIVAEAIGPDELPWIERATIIIYLYPATQEGRCGVVDLLHPSEAHTPRCGNPDCRCMQVMSKEEAYDSYSTA